MGDFSPTKYIDKNVKLQYRNFDVSNNWDTVTVINVHGYNDNIFLGKFVYCDIKFDSGEIYNHFLFTDKEYESNSDNAWKFAHPWCVSINEIKDLNQKLSYTAFDYYNCTSSYDMFSDIQKNTVGHEIDVEEEELEELECDDEELEEEEFDEDEKLKFDDLDNEEFEDYYRPNKKFRIYDNKLEEEDQKCNDNKLEEDQKCNDNKLEEEDQKCNDKCNDECNDELRWGRKGVRGVRGDNDVYDVADEFECNDEESIQSDIISIIYPGFWSTVIISSIVSTIATTMIIYVSHTACSIY